MRILKISLLVALTLALTACACRTKSVGAGNIPVASEGSVLKDINFSFDSYELDQTAQAVLKESAAWLTENADAKTQIEGHCDERGTAEYNMVLGMKRARAAQEYLHSLGIELERMGTVSYGEELPLDPRHSEDAWAKNRRAHFKVE